MRTKILAAALLASVISNPSLSQQRISHTPVLEAGENRSADLRIIETQSGATLQTATADLCFAKNIDFSHGVMILGDYDRVVVPLKIDGQSLAGSTVSEVNKQPVSFNLRRQGGTDGKVSFAGTVTIEGVAYRVDHAARHGVAFVEDEPFMKAELKPESFGHVVAPNTLAVTIKRGSLPELIAFLRSATATLDVLSGTSQPCLDLRLATQQFRVLTAPDRSQALVDALRKLPYVTEAGWTVSIYAQPAARVSANGWVTNGVLDRKTVSAGLSSAIAKHIGGSVVSVDWDDKTGELKVKLKRPSKLFPGIGLTENFDAAVLVAPERFGDTNQAIVWSPIIHGDIADESGGTRVGLVPLTLYAGPPEGIVINIEGEVLGKLLQAEWWDSEKSEWVR